jgi:hypothetical protein
VRSLSLARVAVSCALGRSVGVGWSNCVGVGEEKEVVRKKKD